MVSNSKNNSRRKFLSQLATIGGGIFITSGVGYELSHLFGHSVDEQQTDQVVVNDLSQKIADGDVETVKATLDKHPESQRQILLDAAMCVIFAKGILSKFFEEKFGSAALNMLLSIFLVYLPLATPEARQKVIDVMKSAFGGVGVIMLLVQIGEMFSIDTDQIFSKTLRHKYQNGIQQFYHDTSPIKKWLNKHNIHVDTTRTYNQQVFVDINGNDEDGKIWISSELFFELLPIIARGGSDAGLKHNIIESIARHTRSTDGEINLREIVGGGDDKGFLSKKDDHLSLKQNINQFSLDLIQHELRGIVILFYLTQLPLFGVGQVAVMGDKIHNAIGRIYNIALSNGYGEHYAQSIRANLLALCTSYFPNRLAIASDIGPNTGAFQEGQTEDKGLDGLFTLWKAQLLIAGASGVSFHTQLRTICKMVADIGAGSDKDVEDELTGFNRLFIDALKNITVSTTSLMSDGLHNGANTFKNIGDSIEKEYSSSSIFFVDVSSNEAYRKSMLREATDRLYDLNDFSVDDLKNIATSLTDQLSSSRRKSPKKIIITYGNKKELVFEKFIDIAYFIKKVLQKDIYAGDIHKYFVKILMANESVFVGLQNDLTKMGMHTDIVAFLGDHFTVEKKYTTDDIYKDIYEGVALSFEIPFVFDLSFSINKNPDIHPRSIQSAVALLQNNIAFLSYGKTNVYDNSQYVEQFKNNIQHIYQLYSAAQLDETTTSWDLIVGGLSRYCSDDQRNFFNDLGITLGQDTNDHVILETPKENEQTTLGKIKSLLDTLSDDILDIAFPGTQVRLRSLRDGFEEGYEHVKHMIEQSIGMNSWEVFQMIFLLQSPFVNSVMSTIENSIRAITSKIDLPNSAIEGMIASATYLLSMFADNYIGLVVGVKLCKSLLGYDAITSIKKMGKFSIYGGSMVVTGNAPNPLLAISEKWFTIYDAMPEDEKEEFARKNESLVNKLRELADPSLLGKRDLFKNQLGANKKRSRGLDIFMDIVMLSLMNTTALGKIIGSILLAGRGDKLGNTVAKVAVENGSSALTALLAPFKMVFDRKNK